MRRFEKLFQNFSLSIFSVLLFFCFLEASARIYLEHFTPKKIFKKYASLRQLEKESKGKYRYSLHRYLGYYPTPNFKRGKNKHNSMGYRGDEIELPKPEGEFRIACLGGSTTYTGHVGNYRKSYPEQLEKELKKLGHENVNIINAGAGNWTSLESLINLQFRVLELDPDMIIIYHAINDIKYRMVWPTEVYKGDNSGARPPIWGSIFMPSIFEYSTLLRIFMIEAGLIRPHVAFSRTLDKVPDSFYLYKFRSQKRKDLYPEGFFKEISAHKMLMHNKPKYFERNIENMVIIAKHNNIKVVVATFASSPLFKKAVLVSSQEFISAFKDTNNTLKEIAKEMRVNLFDFAKVFPKDKKYYTDGRHVNAKGAQLKAKFFAEYIHKAKLIPRN
jgi:lysophospholipase L1-like esterase